MSYSKKSDRLILNDNALSCFGDNFIGIRTYCDDEDQPESNLYIDDHEGINILNASDVADSITMSGKKVFETAIRNATNRAINDFVAELSKEAKFQFNGILSDDSLNMSGDYKWFGGKDVFVSILIERSNLDKFQKTCFSDFGFISDSDVDCVEFCLETTYETKVQKFSIKKGYNRLNISADTRANWIRLSFSVKDFSIGRRDNYSSFGCGCLKHCHDCSDKCAIVSCQISGDKSTWENVSDYIGFDACIQCKCDINLIACYFKSELAYPIWLLSGSNFFVESLATDAINPFVTNGKEFAERRIKKLSGDGIDMTDGMKYNSMYWLALKGAANKAKLIVSKIGGKCFSCEANKIVGAKGFASELLKN